ncbi:hypothetical protein DFH27DRAFT_23190 [Peziza echinospora]|nr:hypothetical protein DFH27DRAFT_23190 [Peziza echinospora]
MVFNIFTSHTHIHPTARIEILTMNMMHVAHVHKPPLQLLRSTLLHINFFYLLYSYFFFHRAEPLRQLGKITCPYLLLTHIIYLDHSTQCTPATTRTPATPPRCSTRVCIGLKLKFKLRPKLAFFLDFSLSSGQYIPPVSSLPAAAAASAVWIRGLLTSLQVLASMHALYSYICSQFRVHDYTLGGLLFSPLEWLARGELSLSYSTVLYSRRGVAALLTSSLITCQPTSPPSVF